MKPIISDSLYEERVYTLEGMSIGALWEVSCPDEDIWNDAFPFEEKKEYFFAFLQRLLEDGKIKLASRGEFLEGGIDEQIALYREKFPKKSGGNGCRCLRRILVSDRRMPRWNCLDP